MKDYSIIYIDWERLLTFITYFNYVLFSLIGGAAMMFVGAYIAKNLNVIIGGAVMIISTISIILVIKDNND